MSPEEMERQIITLAEEVKSTRERIDRLDRNGMNTLYYRNIYPESGSGNNGSANQAARRDHDHTTIAGLTTHNAATDAHSGRQLPGGQIHVPVASAAAVTISDTTNYFEANNPAWTLLADSHMFDESAGNGRLTYTGTAAVMLHIACTLSFTCAAANQILHARIGKSGTPDAASEVIFKIVTGTDVASTAIHLVTTLSTGQYLSLWVRNETSAANITVEAANLQCMGMALV